jgi:hypothetical protein
MSDGMCKETADLDHQSTKGLPWYMLKRVHLEGGAALEAGRCNQGRPVCSYVL